MPSAAAASAACLRKSRREPSFKVIVMFSWWGLESLLQYRRKFLLGFVICDKLQESFLLILGFFPVGDFRHAGEFGSNSQRVVQ